MPFQQNPYATNNFSAGTANNLSAEQYGDAGRSMRYPASVLNQSRRYPPKYSGYTMTTRTTGEPARVCVTNEHRFCRSSVRTVVL